MLLPGRIELTTLGDILGALHRERVTGTLEFVEPSGAVHRVLLRDGLVSAVETGLAVPPLGQLLRSSGKLSPSAHTELERIVLSGADSPLGQALVRRRLATVEVVERALREQVLARLNALQRIEKARVAFRPRAHTVERAPLEAREFLHGKPRKRAGRQTSATQTQSAPCESELSPHLRTRAEALAILGLRHGADSSAVRLAFRKLAAELHPDCHAGSGDAQRSEYARRFARVSAAYHLLVA